MLPQSNVILVLRSLNKYGITNPYMQIAILATIAKESAFNPRSENMNYTTPERLMAVFPSYFKTRESALPYVRNPEALANYVYGGKYGNNQSGDGWKYRGRGFNGITFKSNYQKYGSMIGRNLVNNPELANDPQISADLAAVYYIDTLPRMANKYNAKNINDWNDQDTALLAAINATAGAGASQYTIGWNLNAAKKFLNEVSKYVTNRSPKSLIIPILLLAVGSYILIK